MVERLKSKLMGDEVDDMNLETDDSYGQLLQLQQGDAVVQASMIGPQRCLPSRATTTEWS